MEFITQPRNRIEAYLAEIADMHDFTSPPRTRIEQYLAYIAGNSEYLPNEERNRVELLLAKWAGKNVSVTELRNRTEMFINAASTRSISALIPRTRIEEYLAYIANSDPVYNTVTGNPASFFSKFSSPLKSMVADIVPVQDLNGYDKPWPPGGGKNLLGLGTQTFVDSGLTVTPEYNGVNVVGVHVEGTTTRGYSINIATVLLQQGTTYILSGGRHDLGVKLFGTSNFNDYKGQATQVPFEFTPEETKTYYIAIGFSINRSFDVSIYPMLRLASVTDPTFEPYSNICPITGFQSAEIKRYGETESDHLQTVTVEFPTEAGTVYGGTLDVTTGKLTVNTKHIDLSSLSWTASQSLDGFIQTTNIIPDALQSSDGYDKSSIISNSFTGDSPHNVYNRVNNNSICVNNAPRIQIYSSIFADKESTDLVSMLSGIIAVYELATPILYQITPVQISALVGRNQISSNTGPVTVEYLVK